MRYDPADDPAAALTAAQPENTERRLREAAQRVADFVSDEMAALGGDDIGAAVRNLGYDPLAASLGEALARVDGSLPDGTDWDPDAAAARLEDRAVLSALIDRLRRRERTLTKLALIDCAQAQQHARPRSISACLAAREAHPHPAVRVAMLADWLSTHSRGTAQEPATA